MILYSCIQIVFHILNIFLSDKKIYLHEIFNFITYLLISQIFKIFNFIYQQFDVFKNQLSR